MSSLRTDRGQDREDWTDEAFVRNWLRVQEERAPERNRQFAMLCSLIPRADAAKLPARAPCTYARVAGGRDGLAVMIQTK